MAGSFADQLLARRQVDGLRRNASRPNTKRSDNREWNPRTHGETHLVPIKRGPHKFAVNRKTAP